LEEGSPNKIKENKNSKIGKEISDINPRSYVFNKKFSKKTNNNPLFLFDIA
jgi:hypothetical protein